MRPEVQAAQLGGDMKNSTRPLLRRLVTIDRLIRAGGYPNAITVAGELEVHPRTVHRDLEFLRDSWGAPLEFSHRHNGFYYRDPDYSLPPQRLTEGELVALFLAERLMQQYRGTPYAAELAAVFRKLTAGLPGGVTVDLAHLADAYSFRQHAADAGDADRFRRLARAVRERRRLRLEYWTASRDETCTRLVDPYHLASIDGDWYLVAYCHLREDVRMFCPGRIRSLQEMGDRFERPADFRFEDYIDASFRAVRGDGPMQRVRLWFAPKAARYVRERTWHPSQRIQSGGDGSLVLTLKVSHMLEVKRWALSHGAACLVLEPDQLRAEVLDELKSALRHYEPSEDAVANVGDSHACH